VSEANSLGYPRMMAGPMLVCRIPTYRSSSPGQLSRLSSYRRDRA